MAWFICQALLLQILLISLGVASPIVPNTDSSLWARNNPKSAQWNADELNKEFKGIYWNHVVNDETDCTPEQLSKLVWATRATMWLLEGPPKDMEYAYSTAWTRYFGDYKNWLLHGQEYRTIAHNIQFNILQAAKYPREGHRTSSSIKMKAHYTCTPGESRKHGSATEKCASGRTLAVTVEPLASIYEAWTIVFCPLFFESEKLEFLEERKDGKHGQPTGPGHVGVLDTYERTIAHEFMHVGMFGFKDDIQDIEGYLWDDEPVQKIYGEPRCFDFAKRLDNGKPNTHVAVNADTYSWFYTYYYFDKQWGWTTPAHGELKSNPANNFMDRWFDPPDSRNPNLVIPESEFQTQYKDIKVSTNKPHGCQEAKQKDSHGNPVVVCDFIGGDYDEWAEQLDKPFKSNGGCDLSYHCHHKEEGIWTHSECTCTCDGKKQELSDKRCAGFAGLSLHGLGSS